MTKLKKLIGESRAIFASVLCLLSFVLLAPSVLAAEKCTACITFSADKEFGIKLVKGTEKSVPAVNLQYSTDQVNWSTVTAGTGYDAKSDGGVYKIHFRGSGNSQFSSNIYRRFANSFTNTVGSKATAIACSGNVMTLLDWETVSKGQTVTMSKPYTFLCLFCGFTSLTAAPVLPAETLVKNCYRSMFQDCTSLTEAPKLSAKTLAHGCYQSMFRGCTSLKTSPELPATNMDISCYEYMFTDCASLTTVPELPATKLSTLCYECMFSGCKSLTTIPDLNVSLVTNLCCLNMFSNCLGIAVNMTGPGKEWKIPADVVIAGTQVQFLPMEQWDPTHGRNYWASNMFANTSGELNTAAEVVPGKTYYIASAPVKLAVENVSHATYKVYTNKTVEVAAPYVVRWDSEVMVTYTADTGYVFPDGATSWSTNFLANADQMTVALPADQWLLRTPDYTTDDGKDWLYNHAIAGKAYPGEAAESGVDLFYIYPTLNGDEKVVINGFRGIDDETMRSGVLSFSTAAGAFDGTGRCFADLTHVYAPYYRQATFDTAVDCATNAQGEVAADANARYVKTIAQGPSYADVTNALTTYFAKWNKGRKLVLAGHSQGSALLRLLMRDYFTLPENRDKAKKIVCSYQIGFGLSAAEMDDIANATGVTLALKPDDTNVIVSYNTMGDGSSGSSVLLPPDTIAINPLTWTIRTDLAEKDLNLGALTNELGKADVIVPHLYGAQVVDTGFNRGNVVVCKELNGEVLEPSIYGTGSLHTKDYGAFWEDLHKNCYDRIMAATVKAPVVGKPMDYADPKNWMRLGDKNNPKSTAKLFDIFYLYPTSTGSSDYVAPVDQNMKDAALGAYKQAVEPLESYANVYAPYYRQISATGIMADPTADGLQQNIARHVGKTDVFAALDYYFTNVNAGVVRPFVFAAHSQGSASLKNAFEQYFVGEKKAYLKKMIAAYTVGYTFSTDWCAKYGVTFATGAADTGVLLTWNAEGPDAPALANMLTKDPNGQAINPLNWMRDETYAAITENLGSFSTDGTRVAGAADAQLKAARPGALVVTNQTGYAYAPAVLFGEESYHLNDWGMFRENACANILARGKDLTGYCKLCTTNFPAHLCVSNASIRLTSGSSSAVDPVGGTVWIPTNGFELASVYLVAEKGYRLIKVGKESPSASWGIALNTLQSNGEFLVPADFLNMLEVEYIQRAPDYAAEDGKDWLFHHDIDAKRYEGEPAEDPGVDLFYFYPTSVNVSDDHCVDGICDIDDEYLRSDKGALSAWDTTGKVFGDFTHVYAPYYRQTPVDVEMTFTPQEGCYDKITEFWYEREPYADVTNALTHYFTKINPDGKRPFVLAGHSHGAGMLALAMEHFFADHRPWLKNMVACYAIGMGVSDKWEEAVKKDPGVTIATNATDAGVYVFWNTEGPGTSEEMISGLWPTNHVAGVNPITWTRTSEYAPASLNLGGWTADDAGAIRPGLYDASNNVAHGTVVCSSPDLVERYMDVSFGFGEKSLHDWDYKLYWENLRANALQRIKTMNAMMGRPDYVQIPLAGTPIDYSDPYNWVTNTGTAKTLDVFYVYPTMMLEGDSTVVPVTDAMKNKAYEAAYVGAASAFASYANVLIPAYRQMNKAALTTAQALYPESCDVMDCLKGQVSRTDLFAALDYYFTNLNANAERPFILAGHSQGSAMLKIAFEDYFRSNDARGGYLAKMVAAYPLGSSFSQEWCKTFGYTFATNKTDASVLVSWNTEGPNAQARSFAIENGALAINPMTWTTDVDVWSETVPDAMIQKRTATDFDYGEKTYALVTTNSTEYLDPEKGMGDKSLHGKDWTLWFDQIKANGFTRYVSFAGLVEVVTNGLPVVADVTSEVKVDGQTAMVNPVDGKFYAPADAAEVKLVYTLDAAKAAAGYYFADATTEISFTMKSEGGVWVSTATKAEIAAATKVGKPSVQLGIVAQRYPWNGMIDVEYWASYTPNGTYQIKVTVTLPDGTAKSQTANALNGKNAMVFDAKAAFGEVKLTGVKVTAELVEAPPPK